ncbi:hypothetical protein ACFWYW_58660 [Nonomuraea sp. NPDC059023]|uniref:hypothetical protein n=1 Tax=unclassified Nonomuraea TaxID=2593643 RepID=UPI0036CBB378
MVDTRAAAVIPHRKRIHKLEARIKELEALLVELHDPSPCEHFDHDGECHTHGPTSTWDGCPHAHAQALLAALPERSADG